ncbi:MAG: hypothetical protein SLRJCFUN_000534 [Candidatus Fervidibacter sp.]
MLPTSQFADHLGSAKPTLSQPLPSIEMLGYFNEVG